MVRCEYVIAFLVFYVLVHKYTGTCACMCRHSHFRQLCTGYIIASPCGAPSHHTHHMHTRPYWCMGAYVYTYVHAPTQLTHACSMCSGHMDHHNRTPTGASACVFCTSITWNACTVHVLTTASISACESNSANIPFFYTQHAFVLQQQLATAAG